MEHRISGVSCSAKRSSSSNRTTRGSRDEVRASNRANARSVSSLVFGGTGFPTISSIPCESRDACEEGYRLTPQNHTYWRSNQHFLVSFLNFCRPAHPGSEL